MTPPLVSREMTSENRAAKFHTDDALHQSGVVLLIGFRFVSSNQKHYRLLGSDASSVWNFGACFSDFISRGNQWWRREISALFSVYIVGTLRSEDGDGRENVAEKVNSRSFNLHRSYSKSLTLSNLGEPSKS